MKHVYNLSHIKIPVPAPTMYKAERRNIEKSIPPRNRQQHVVRLKKQVAELEENLKNIDKKRKDLGIENVSGITVTLKSNQNYDLVSKAIEGKRENVEIINEGTNNQGEQFAVVRFGKGSLSPLRKKVEEYGAENTKKGTPRHNDLVASIEKINQVILEEFWVGPNELLPLTNDQAVWWELWLLGGKDNVNYAKEMREQFLHFTKKSNIEFDDETRIEFADRQVFVVKATKEQMSKAITYLDCIAELRPPSRGIRDWHVLEHSMDLQIPDIIKHITPPDLQAPTVTLIDTGVNNGHPFLQPAIPANGLHTIDPRSSMTSDYNGHGTEMAGVALYDDLSKVLLSSNQYKLPAYLESVRVNLTGEKERNLWGTTTERAVQKAESTGKKNRIFCMAIGAQSLTGGKPSSWSAMVDKLCYGYGHPRLMTIAAGNVDPIDTNYPTRNLSTQLDDPAQAKNAITVGAMCNYDQIVNPPVPNISAIAQAGQLSPHSSTHGVLNDAIKPDIVCEGGNVGWDGTFADSGLEGLSILTTDRNFTRRAFTLTYGTSPASAAAARMLAQIWGENPTLRPETVRALLIHSASWTKQMELQFPNKRDLLRACGYGVPNIEMACKSAKSAVTLIAEGIIRPYYIEMVPGKRKLIKGKEKRDIIIFDIPWPEKVLQGLGEKIVELRVTLSYFAEPNPKNLLKSYEGASLEWDLQKPDETVEQFAKRVNAAEREEGERSSGTAKDWQIGKRARSKGTVQSDRWRGTAFDLSQRRKLAVYPTNGWWRANSSKYPDPEVPFSLIISIATDDTELDLYTHIKNEIKLSADIDT